MFELSFHYAYLMLTLPFLLIWVAMYITYPQLRKPQLQMSLWGCLVGTISELFYFRDYWLPETVWGISFPYHTLMVEDLIFGFSLGGIAFVLYNAFFGRFRESHARQDYGTVIILTPSVIIVTVTLLLMFLGVNSIYASAVSFVMAGGFVVHKRPDLWKKALFSGLGVALVMLVSYATLSVLAANVDEILARGWLLYNTPLDIRLLGSIPLTEMIWGLAVGFMGGPTYEFIYRRRFDR